jgi:hypothetical protein
MSDMLVFVLGSSIFWIVLGILWLRRGYSGVSPKPEFITIGRNPSPPEPLSPRMQISTKFLGFAYIGLGLVGLVLGARHVFHGR